MHSLPESLIQSQQTLRDAILAGDASGVGGGLVHPQRFAIHLRNFEASLVSALLTKFPATQWLVGTQYLTQVATHFVHEHPPSVPCIAEYGWDFPEYLAACPGSDRIPYLHDFALLELRVGHVSIATSEPPCVRYLQSDWPVDLLLNLFLTDTAPDQLTFEPCPVHLEISGARGEFQIRREQVPQGATP